MANVREIITDRSRTVGATVSSGFNGCEPLETISTTRIRSTFDGKKLSGNSTVQIEIGVLGVIGDFVFQAGYRKASGATIPFTDYTIRTPVTVTILNGGTGPFYINAKNTFELYKYTTATYRYKRNNTDILQFELSAGDLPIKDMNVHILTIGSAKVPTVNFYPALEYDSGGNYINALAGRNIYGAGLAGFEGKLQNGTLRDCELNAGTRIAKTAYGDLLWGTV